MKRSLAIYSLPEDLSPADLAEGVVVIIDVFRASTTIVHALTAGAKSIIPCKSVSEAKAFNRQGDPEGILLGGERDGVMIPGFDLGNSPLNYSEAVVAGKEIIFTTTNGTNALMHAQQADDVIVGCFSNINVIIEYLLESDMNIHLVCAGTNGKPTPEDTLCAGAIGLGVTQVLKKKIDVSEAATEAIEAYKQCAGSVAKYKEKLYSGPGAENLKELGMFTDLARCAVWDLSEIIPRFELETRRIEAIEIHLSDAYPRLNEPGS